VHSFKYAIRFIWASFSLAFKKVQLQEQWLYISVGNLVLLFIWFLPLGLTVGLIGLRPVGMALIGLTSIFMLFSFYIWGEITREDASKRLASYFQDSVLLEEDEQQKAPLFEHWPDILIWTIIKPVLGIQYNLQQLLRQDGEEIHPWFASHALIIPLISLEALSLKEAISRIEEMISGHLLRFKPGFVKVDLFAKLISWMMGIVGFLTGLIVMLISADPFSMEPGQRVLAVGIGLLVGWFFITLGHLFSAYVRSCYHTALYQWVINVKDARELNEPKKANPPEILQKALGQSDFLLNKKER